ncbi:MAG: cell division ATP-binding protein FtsE [Alphaproteobacteria bacterium]|nr:cell division ATP-binding protein FtsE [Alphaproteobacteria bacterium]
MLRFENVGLRYDEGPEVLKDVTFELHQGSFHFLTGRSGAGKTSLLRLLYLAGRPTRGFISLFGHDIATTPRAALPALRRRIGVVFQDFRLIDHLTSFENVALPLRISGMTARDYKEDVEELLAWVGLKDQMGARPPTLSGGEKQRVAIARAIVAKPDLLLADEPTGNVDHEMGLRLLRLFVELNRLGTTVLIATHDRTLTARIDAPHLHLEAGRLAILSAAAARDWAAEAEEAAP